MDILLGCTLLLLSLFSSSNEKVLESLERVKDFIPLDFYLQDNLREVVHSKVVEISLGNRSNISSSQLTKGLESYLKIKVGDHCYLGKNRFLVPLSFTKWFSLIEKVISWHLIFPLPWYVSNRGFKAPPFRHIFLTFSCLPLFCRSAKPICKIISNFGLLKKICYKSFGLDMETNGWSYPLLGFSG